MRWAWRVAGMGRRQIRRDFGGKPEQNRSLGRPRSRWGKLLKSI
jgi:hypothetical protein